MTDPDTKPAKPAPAPVQPKPTSEEQTPKSDSSAAKAESPTESNLSVVPIVTDNRGAVQVLTTGAFQFARETEMSTGVPVGMAAIYSLGAALGDAIAMVSASHDEADENFKRVISQSLARWHRHYPPAEETNE